MNKSVILFIFLFIYVFALEAQNAYSSENLEQTSVEDLNILLNKAKKVKKVGAIMLIGGPVISLSGYGLFSLAWSGGGSSFMAGTGLIMFIGGIGTTIVGIPVFATGAVRKNKITQAFQHKNTGMELRICPSNMFDNQTQTYCPGITLSLRF